MKFCFENAKVRKECTEPENEFRGDSRLIRGINNRMGQINAADHLLDVKELKDVNFHPLKGNRKFEIAIDAYNGGKRGKYRIIFTLPEEYKNVFMDMNNDSKLKKVKKIIILEITKKHYK